MRTSWIALAAGVLFLAGCESRGPAAHIIAGPAVPSPVPLSAPFVWDTQEQLAVWTENSVSRGSFWIDNDGADGTIAIEVPVSAPAAVGVLLRGPDFEPPVRALRTVQLRYKWLPTSGSSSLGLRAIFQPVVNDSGYQSTANASLKAGTEWQYADVGPIYQLSGHAPGTIGTPDVRYVYFTMASGSSVGGLLKIDSISLVQ